MSTTTTTTCKRNASEFDGDVLDAATAAKKQGIEQYIQMFQTKHFQQRTELMLIPYLAKIGKSLDDLYAYAKIDRRLGDNKNNNNNNNPSDLHPPASKKHKIASPSPADAAIPIDATTKQTTSAEEDRERIQKLTKKEIMEELGSIGDSTYSQYWKKSELVDHLVEILRENQQHIETQLTLDHAVVVDEKLMVEDYDIEVKCNNDNNSLENDANRDAAKEEQVMPLARMSFQEENDNPIPNQVSNAVAAVEKLTIRDSSSKDEKEKRTLKESSKTTCMSVDDELSPKDQLQNPTKEEEEPPSKDSPILAVSKSRNDKNDENIPSQKQEMHRMMDDEDYFGTAQEFLSESQDVGMMHYEQSNFKKYESTLSPIPGSAMKTMRSPLTTVVNPGHVESAKKLFEKNAPTKPSVSSLTHDSKDVHSSLDMINIGMKPVATSGQMIAAKTNPMRPGLAAAALSASKTRTALKSKQAQERLEKMREKSKKTGNLVSSTSSSSAALCVQAPSLMKHKVAHSSNADRIQEIRKIALQKESTASSAQFFSQKKQQPRLQPTPIIISKPEDNYEMSDSGSDSDDSEVCHRRAGKRIPDWARSKNLIPAIEYQYSKEYPIDPDELFGEVETCDLCEIFPNSERQHRYKRRNSSGNWTEHRLTEEEKARYKQLISAMNK